jgi:hypothetical protein
MQYPDNGIMASVPGQFIARGSQQLPDPETATEAEMSVTLEADFVGRVRITYRRQLARHRKHSHWYWAAVRAETLTPSSVQRDARSNCLAVYASQAPSAATATTPIHPAPVSGTAQASHHGRT